MIIVRFSHPLLRTAVRRAARSDEDVVGPELADEALARGFPRIVVRLEGTRPAGPACRDPVPTVVVTEGRLEEWEARRRAEGLPRSRLDVVAARMGALFRDHASGPVWVDRALADLGRASGIPLPPSFRGMARRVMEFPSRYSDLGALAELSGVGRDALRARFRRRDLASPSVWLRWFRLLAAAHLLSDRSISVQAAAHRLGFNNDGNFCRLVSDVWGLSPTEARTPVGRARLLSAIALELGSPGCREGWEALGGLFLEGAA